MVIRDVIDDEADMDGVVREDLFLSEGEHFITLTATDASSRTGSDGVAIVVGPASGAPSCSITPLAAPHRWGTAGELVGSTVDPDIAENELTATWSSDLDGTLSTGAPASDGRTTLALDTLSRGLHEITLSVVDDLGTECTDTAQVRVGGPPEVTIVAPLSGASLDEGSPVSLEVQIADLDGDTTFDLTWASNVDGTLGGTRSIGLTDATTAVLSEGAHLLTVRAEDTWGFEGTSQVAVTVGPAVSTLVGVSEVTITPSTPTAEDELRCTWSGFTGSTDQSSRAWTVNGLSAGSTEVLGQEVARGDVVVCEVTPSDGSVTGVPVRDTVVVRNALPVVSGVQITPEAPSTDDTLVCGWDFADADGDADQSSVAWYVDGLYAGSGPSLSGQLPAGSEVTCSVLPDDGYGIGVPVETSVTLGAGVPSVGGVQIAPNPATVVDTLSCTWSDFQSPTGGSDVSSRTWVVGGAAAGDGPTPSVAPSRGDVVTCTVTPDDGTSTGTPVAADITIQNAPPVVVDAEIEPMSPVAQHDDLVCRTSATPSDADGDALTVTFTWERNGIVYTGPRSQTERAGDTVPASAVAPGDVWRCTISVGDGLDWSVGAFDEVVAEDPATTCAGSGMYFDGPSSTVDVSQGANSVSDASTIEFWMRWDAGASEYIVRLIQQAAVSFEIDDDGYVSVYRDNFVGTGDSRCRSEVPVAASQWTHVAWSDGKLWMNGVPRAHDCGTRIIGSLPTIQFNDDGLFTGVLDEVRVSSVARYTSPFVPSPNLAADPLTIALFGFDEGSGDVVGSEGSAGLTGLRVGADWVDEGSCEVALSNVPPGVAEPAISPLFALEGQDDLVCEVGIEAGDANGDVLDYIVHWYVDGAPWAGPTTATMSAGDTIPHTATLAGSWFGCAIQATDGSAVGPMSGLVERLVSDRIPRYTSAGSYVDGVGELRAGFQSSLMAPLGPFLDYAHNDNESKCGIDEQGVVHCQSGADLVADTPIETDVPTGVFVQIEADANDACAIDSSGMPLCWGQDAGVVNNVPSVAALDIDVSSGLGCMVRATDGALQCWGASADAAWVTGLAGPFDEVVIVTESEIVCAHLVGGGWTCEMTDPNPSNSVESFFNQLDGEAALDGVDRTVQPGRGGYCYYLADRTQFCTRFLGGSYNYYPSAGEGVWLADPIRFADSGGWQICGLDEHYRRVCVNGAVGNVSGPTNFHERWSEVAP